MLSLDGLFECTGQPVIHWLKVDVEGSEKSVLESWKESKARPWILVIECTEPGSQEETYIQWEDLVLSKGYQLAYFDGLNRFYVFSEQSYLLSAFRTPPNIYDGFMLSGKASQPFYKLLETKAEQTEVRVQGLVARMEEAEVALNAVYASRSWRITAPLRWLCFQARLLRHHGLCAYAKALGKKLGKPEGYFVF